MRRLRRNILRVLALCAKYPQDPDVRAAFVDSFGYPDDLPDLLSLRPPGGNSREANVLVCFAARRQRNELADVY